MPNTEQTPSAVVVDEDSATQPGEVLTVVAEFFGDTAEAEAVRWIDQQDPSDVRRGRYGIDVSPHPNAEEA